MDSLDGLPKEDLSEVPSFIIKSAVSYGIGRKSYAVGIITDFLKSHWNELSAQTQRTVQNQVQAAKDREDRTAGDLDPLGDEIDRRRWLEILELPVATD